MQTQKYSAAVLQPEGTEYWTILNQFKCFVIYLYKYIYISIESTCICNKNLSGNLGFSDYFDQNIKAYIMDYFHGMNHQVLF